MTKQRQPRLHRLGDATSQWFNVLIFNADPNYSISGDAYRFKRKRLCQFIDWLCSPFERDHCQRAWENDIAKAVELLAEVQP